MIQQEHEGARKTGSENYRAGTECPQSRALWGHCTELREQVLAMAQVGKGMRWKVRLGTHKSQHLESSLENLLKNDGEERHKVQSPVSVN